MISTDNEIKENVLETTEQPIKRGRGRPRRVEDIDRKIYMHSYYKTHYSPKQPPTEAKIHKTADMKAYQKAYREKQKLKKLQGLNFMD
jgi:hypothetical protein